MHINPYSAPNPLDTVVRLEQHLCRRLPARYFRMAEIFACLQTLDDAVVEKREKSRRRDLAAETWQELAGDLLCNIPVLTVRNQDPFRVARADFPPSACPHCFRHQLDVLLTHMATAAKATIGAHQRYSDNYHGVIAYQLSRLSLMTAQACADFHTDIIHMPVPKDDHGTHLVYPPDYSADSLPRGSDDGFDLSEYPHPTFH